MKKLSLFLMAFLTAILASAEPANPTPINVTQPDGSTLQLILVGDEFYHFNTTIDGYTIVNINGTWEYATKDGERLVSSGVMAHNPASRDTKEMQLVASLDKRLVDKAATTQARENRATRDKKNQQNRDNREPVVDYSAFRGLIVLINFNDRQFLMDNPNDFYNQLCNTENYTGFYHNGRFQRCTGSVRDYYYDNSMGQFDPNFDIAGPVNLNYSCYEGNDKAREIFKAALDSIDDQVDFSLYDADNDGEIDMVFFLVAGYASSYSGNNSGYLWPHMSYLIDWWSGWPPQPYIYDGKRMGTYASSCEIYGWESQHSTMPNAIGTICHEFGHVLGLPDLYDTDYSDSGGESNHPGDWDVMAGGSYSNYGRTPVGYSLWERMELGFTDTPEELILGEKTLSALNESNTGYMMQSPSEFEFFLFENRQPNKWDAALPGHGLVITRVDYSNEEVWWSNEVNCNPSHNYYELIRSSGAGSGEVPFPGSRNVTLINSSTYPALVTWAEEPCQFGLNNISEDNSIITFNVVNDVPPLNIVEDFELMQTGLPANATNVQGNFATWNFPKADVVDYNGQHAASLQMPGGIAMNSDIDVQAIKISLNAVNTSTTASKIQLYYSTDEGATWTSIGTESVKANSDEAISWRLNLSKQPMRFKINRTSGAKNVNLIIDNITIHYIGKDNIPGDVNGDGVVTAADVTALYDFLLNGDITHLINGDQNGDQNITASDVTAVYDVLLGINEGIQ
ncbi:MAG: M6 family metalloprotease domain-containing protein [Muribaculaceae bacterium]|nr:M6 family metalloprotease domain-containing protein [Muribaculaceae bacterium]